MKKRSVAALLCLVMALSLSACKKPAAGQSSASGDISASKPDASVSITAPETVVNVMVMSGPTGVGAAKLMADNAAAGDAAAYNFTVVAGNDEVAPAIAKGEADIACIATNVASNLYNKNGGITVLAANTLGVLYILEKGNSVTDVASLKGKTIYANGQGANPEYIINHLLTQNGIDPASDVDLQFMTPQEVTAKMVQSTDGVCMLPVPAATALMFKDSAVREAINVSAAWDEISESPLVMGCVVVRNQFMNEHPELVEQFLTDYENSISFMKDEANLTQAAEYVAQFGITANAAIAAKAIPQCNLTYLTGVQMRDAIQGYYEILFSANPASIGGGNPDDDFYYVP
ncbi:MAG: ABC transporter substrate-binding protein [Oscillospiraceae bacterium]|nr:ABC transporter substrate-binding protein [Oscillospiraceae bacterium]